LGRGQLEGWALRQPRGRRAVRAGQPPLTRNERGPALLQTARPVAPLPVKEKQCRTIPPIVRTVNRTPPSETGTTTASGWRSWRPTGPRSTPRPRTSAPGRPSSTSRTTRAVTSPVTTATSPFDPRKEDGDERPGHHGGVLPHRPQPGPVDLRG